MRCKYQKHYTELHSIVRFRYKNCFSLISEANFTIKNVNKPFYWIILFGAPVNREAIIMYKRIQGAHSPLSPLPQPAYKPLFQSPSYRYFSPSLGNQSRNSDASMKRSFTPGLNVITPPPLSPIPIEMLRVKTNDVLNTTFNVNDSLLNTPNKTGGKCDDLNDSDVSIYFTPPEFPVVQTTIHGAPR